MAVSWPMLPWIAAPPPPSPVVSRPWNDETPERAFVSAGPRPSSLPSPSSFVLCPLTQIWEAFSADVACQSTTERNVDSLLPRGWATQSLAEPATMERRPPWKGREMFGCTTVQAHLWHRLGIYMAYKELLHSPQNKLSYWKLNSIGVCSHLLLDRNETSSVSVATSALL